MLIKSGVNVVYLIIGASGFIGRHLYDYCKLKNIDVCGTYYKHSYNQEWIQFDICTDSIYELCDNQFGGDVPDAVIICGANASIDSCKKDENASNDLNVIGTKRILDEADKMGIKSIFLSSEAVFDGKKGMYTEEDHPNPVTLYGEQKLEIEQYILQNIEKYIIFRISRAVGSKFGENDIFDQFYKKVMGQEDIVCLKNQSFCITEIEDIAHCMILALEHNVRGLYHLSSMNYITRYKLAELYVKKMFGGYKKIYEKDYSEIPFTDARHIYGGLNGKRLADTLQVRYKSIPEIMDNYICSCRKKQDEE